MNLDDAKAVLEYAYEASMSEGSEVDESHKKMVDSILQGTHLTYKYILFTALLAKSTDESINALALQAGADVENPYDARSLCHKVIVPFEKIILDSALGGSNEPFLNKPARFPTLSTNNAVRAGRDAVLLKALCDGIPEIETAKAARNALIYFLSEASLLREQRVNLRKFEIIENNDSKIAFYKFINESLEQSFEGEILTLVVAGLYGMLFNDAKTFQVEVHPVNQSGASGSEVSDLDIYRSGKLFATNELKDKNFETIDVVHAADKVRKSGFHQMNFIYGRKARVIPNGLDILSREYRLFTNEGVKPS